jgi:MraZ protein
MSLFLSTFCNKLDKKGRVSVPASFRGALMSETFSGIIAFRSLESPVIEGCGIAVIDELSRSMGGLRPIHDATQEWAHVIFSDAHQLPFDSEGRICLPEVLCQHAGIDDSVSFVGRGSTFQLWNPKLFQQHQEEMRLRVIQQRSQSKEGSAVLPIAGGDR